MLKEKPWIIRASGAYVAFPLGANGLPGEDPAPFAVLPTGDGCASRARSRAVSRTGAPRAPGHGPDRCFQSPHGVIPPGYRGELARREIVGGIGIVRVPPYAAVSKGLAKRILDHVARVLFSALMTDERLVTASERLEGLHVNVLGLDEVIAPTSLPSKAAVT